MKIRDIIKLSVSLLIIIGILYYLYIKGYFEMFSQVTFKHLIILIGLTLLSYFLSGIQLFLLIKHRTGLKIKTADILLLPLSMSLSSYVIPTNGGLLFSVFFLKKKYGIETTKGFSIGVFTIYISLILVGLFGLVSSLVFGKIYIYLLLVSVVLIISPLLVYGFNLLIQKTRPRKGSLFDRSKNYLNSVVLYSNELIVNRKMILLNTVITILAMALLYLMYYMVNVAFTLNLPITSIIVLMIMMRISTLVRLLPGNLGLEELFTAGIFALIGKDPSIGLVFSLFFRMCTFVVVIPLGILHTAFNSKHFRLKDLRKSGKNKKSETESCDKGS
jgi:uncharacterized membrane protein YbhN (UPF0104 family)